jgi:MFS family permease
MLQQAADKSSMDISFPASASILSDAVPIKYQGVSASLVNTVVNYSIAIGLGIAGTVEAQVNKDGNHVLEGYRAAMYTAVGLSGLGLVISVIYGAFMSHSSRRSMNGSKSS